MLREDCNGSRILVVLLRLTTRQLVHGNCCLTPSHQLPETLLDKCMEHWDNWSLRDICEKPRCIFMELCFFPTSVIPYPFVRRCVWHVFYSIYLTRCNFVTLTKDLGFSWVPHGWEIGCPLITFPVEWISLPFLPWPLLWEMKKETLWNTKFIFNKELFVTTE